MNSQGRRPLICLICFLALGLLPVSACGSKQPQPKHVTDLSLTTGKPDLSEVDTGRVGATVGDYTVFSAEIIKDGLHTGWLYGKKTLVALPGQRGAGPTAGRFLNELTFVLTDGTITAQGVQDIALAGGSAFQLGNSTDDERAITGGTGAYEGVTGSVKAHTQPDGSREQHFHFD